MIAAITSCTNTSNPSVMVGAGLLAKKAVEAGLERMPWVKTSLAPGSKVVTDYLERAGLLEPLSRLGFDLVGYGCTTCIGNSGPLPEDVSKEIEERDLVVASVLSGNRNFEGRIHPEVKMNYLASPPLCVAYALAGRMDVDITTEPLQNDVFLRDIWPSQQEVNEAIEQAIESDMFRSSYGDALFEGDENWRGLEIAEGDRYAWDDESTYVKQPPYFEDMPAEAPGGFGEIKGARAIALLGDSVTTDHISPAGAIKKDSPAGQYLIDHGVEQRDFNSYGSRRGNHEVMVRGTFANIRLRNLLAPETEGGFTKKDGNVKPIYDAALEFHQEGTPLCVIAGKEYGSGSSRDWAAKGPRLLGVRFVLAESYERIHRSNLVGMGILPLQFPDGESAGSLGLTRRGGGGGGGKAPPGRGAPGRGGAPPRPDRHSERVALLPPRRNPALRAARPARALIGHAICSRAERPYGAGSVTRANDSREGAGFRRRCPAFGPAEGPRQDGPSKLSALDN